MKWDVLFDKSHKPNWSEITSHINNKLWENLNNYIQEVYNIEPELSYSMCSAQRGWNIKYKKSGKSLCTLYPEEWYFIALVVIGSKEELEADLLKPHLTDYVRNLYNNTRSMKMGRWLMINVTDESILDDIKLLINLRIKPKTKNLL